MAVRALGAQRAFVLVILLVAGIAVLRRFTVLLASHVALVTGDFLVLALEGVVSLVVVVELLLVELGAFQVTTFVFGVAVLAHHGLFQTAVEAGFAPNIHAYRLVTIHAQAVLRLAVKLYVALLAVVLVFGMALHQLSRRHDGLNALRLHGWCERQRHTYCARNAQDLP
jgi:hypothetical protein